jgi:hypothetical protein
MPENATAETHWPQGQMLVVVASLEEVYPLVAHQIDNPVFPSKPPGPRPRSKVLERLRLSNAREWVAPDGIDDVQDAASDLAIGINPVPEILKELRLEDKLSSLTRQDRPL